LKIEIIVCTVPNRPLFVFFCNNAAIQLILAILEQNFEKMTLEDYKSAYVHLISKNLIFQLTLEHSHFSYVVGKFKRTL